MTPEGREPEGFQEHHGKYRYQNFELIEYFNMKRELIITGNTYPVASRLRKLGCKWDREIQGWIAPNRKKYNQAREIVFKNDSKEGSTLLSDWSKQRSVQNSLRRSARA
jgi:hypothetical protein